MKIEDLIPQIYSGLGEIDQQALPMNVVLTKLNSVLSMNLKKLNLSNLNWFMTSYIVPIFSGKDDYEDFPGDWGRDIHAQYSADRVRWYALDLVNVNYLDEIGRAQRPSAGIYGTPPHLKLRNVPVGTIAVQIWYEPDKGAPPNWSANLSDSVRAGFEPGIVAETQFMCAPFVNPPLSKEMYAVIIYEKDAWIQLREEYIYRPRATGRVPKRGFVVGRSRCR